MAALLELFPRIGLLGAFRRVFPVSPSALERVASTAGGAVASASGAADGAADGPMPLSAGQVTAV